MGRSGARAVRERGGNDYDVEPRCEAPCFTVQKSAAGSVTRYSGSNPAAAERRHADKPAPDIFLSERDLRFAPL
jgi:hypothetical protein